MGQLRHWTCQKGGLPDRFESKVAAHAIADIGSNVTKAQKRVRLPPFLIPVTHLHFSFPSRRESLHLFPPLVVALSTVASPKEPESMENEAISPEPNKRNQTIGVFNFIKRISQRQRFCLSYLGDGLPGGEPNVY